MVMQLSASRTDELRYPLLQLQGVRVMPPPCSSLLCEVTSAALRTDSGEGRQMGDLDATGLLGAACPTTPSEDQCR